MVAQQESLGDLKLYRIPIPVTVAAASQKQVALLVRQGVKVDVVYRSRIWFYQPAAASSVERLLRTKNVAERGLGVPLPAGGVLLMKEGALRPLVYGRGALEDKAVGEDVDIAFGAATGVQVSAKILSPKGYWTTEVEYSVANARDVPVAFELDFDGDEFGFFPETALARKNGRPIWAVTVPANGRATLRYRYSKR